MSSSKVKCTCGWSWNKSDSSKKDMYICHECGRDNSNNMKNGGWLDSYADGGTMQEHQENYNDSSVSLPEGYVGEGYNTKGRNYSPAWGGQFEEGGEISMAQTGRKLSPTIMPIGNPNLFIDGSNWVIDGKVVNKTKSNARTLNIVDPRKKMATTNKPLRPNSDLVGGKYSSNHLDKLMQEAKRQKLSKQDMINLSAMGFQETKWDKADEGNIGHTIGDWKGKDEYQDFINAYKLKMKEADRLGIKDPATRLQIYNGFGKVYPSTEKDYHGFNMKKIYGVPVPKEGIDMKKNPLYGKQVIDIRDNVLAKNPEYLQYIDSIYKAPVPKYINDPKVNKLHHDPKKHQMGGSVYPVNYVPEAQMGASIPGAVGFSYARTQSPAPSNGKYAKKTMASAQNGIKKPIPSLKEFRESLKKDKVVDYKERPREAVRDNTAVVMKVEKGKQKTVNPNQQVSTKHNAEKQEKQIVAERKAKIAASIKAQDEDIIGNPNWREVMARETQATGDKFRLFPEEDSFFDDYLNPAVMIGNMASDLGNAPLRAQQEDSYMPYVTSIGIPLLTGGIEGIGASSNRQFVNNIANPFNVVPGYSSARKYVGNKLGKATSNFESQLVQNFPKKGSLLPVMNEHLSGIGLGIKDVAKGRPFFETFPITQAQRQASDIAQNKAMQEGVDFVNDWFYKNGQIRPNIAGKIDNMFLNEPNFLSSKYHNNPLLNVENKLVSSRSNDLPFENISDEAKKYIESERGGILGANIGNTQESITLRNLGMYKIPPSNIKSTVVHEAGHSAQDIRDYNSWGSMTTMYSPDFKYYTSNPNTIIGQRFKNALRTPTKTFGNTHSHRTWQSSPNELHSDLMSARSNMYDDFLQQGKSPEEAMDLLQNPSDETLDNLINTGGLDQFFKQSRWGKSRVPIETKRDLLRMLPAAVPLTVGATALQQQKDGGVIKDDMGQWAHPGEITEIGSNQITMEGVPYPVLGISDTGDMQMMYPEEDYEFDGESVTEYPMAKNGIRQEQKGLVNLDQLTNFTNYNTKQPGGWLDKY
jgi:hypothetical protein